MGLPHILVRFYTNPDGHAARRTTVRVLGPAGALLPVPRHLRGARAGADAAAVHDRPDRRRRADACLRPPGPARPGRCSRAITVRGRVRRVPVDLVRAAGLAGRHVHPRRLAAPAPHGALRAWRCGGCISAWPRWAAMVIPSLRRAGRARGRHLDPRRLGVRAGGEHVLPDVPARHLVDAADSARRRRRHVRRNADRDIGDLRRARSGRADQRRHGAAATAGDRLGPRCLPDDDRRLAPRPAPRVRTSNRRCSRCTRPRDSACGWRTRMWRAPSPDRPELDVLPTSAS